MPPRPYRLIETENGIVGEQLGTYGSPEAAWRRFDQEVESIRGFAFSYRMYYVVMGPNFFEWDTIHPGHPAGGPAFRPEYAKQREKKEV